MPIPNADFLDHIRNVLRRVDSDLDSAHLPQQFRNNAYATIVERPILITANPTSDCYYDGIIQNFEAQTCGWTDRETCKVRSINDAVLTIGNRYICLGWEYVGGVMTWLTDACCTAGSARMTFSPYDDTFSTNKNDYPSLSFNWFRFSISGSPKLTGITNKPDGSLIEITVLCSSTGYLDITHDDAASTAANRIYTPTGQTVRLYACETIALKYDSTRQRWIIGERPLSLPTQTTGTPSFTANDGQLALDTTNNKLYYRSGGTWRDTAGTGGACCPTVSESAPGSPSDGNWWLKNSTRTMSFYAAGIGWYSVCTEPCGGGDMLSTCRFTPNSITSNTTLAVGSDDEIWQYLDSSGGAFTITLPTTSGNDCIVFGLKHTTGSNLITINTDNSGEYLRGVGGNKTSLKLSLGETLIIRSNGTHWHIETWEWNRVAFKAKNTSSQGSITTGTFVKLTLNTEDYDTHGCFDSTTNYRFTPTSQGMYQFVATCEFGTLTAGNQFTMSLYKNGAEHYRFCDVIAATTSSNTLAHGVITTTANGSSDYFEVFIWQNSGATKSTGASSVIPTRFEAMRMSPFES
jgi:hypothetical protein